MKYEIWSPSKTLVWQTVCHSWIQMCILTCQFFFQCISLWIQEVLVVVESSIGAGFMTTAQQRSRRGHGHGDVDCEFAITIAIQSIHKNQPTNQIWITKYEQVFSIQQNKIERSPMQVNQYNTCNMLCYSINKCLVKRTTCTSLSM